MKINKHKLAANIIHYLTGANSDINLNLKEKSNEQDYLSKILKENYDAIQIKAPHHILDYIKLKNSSKPERYKPFQNIFRHLRPSILAPAIIIVISIFILWKPAERKIPLPLTTIGREFVNIGPQYILEKHGIHLFTSRMGTVAIKNNGSKDHIFLKSGSWQIETEHNLFEKETWFHFPGGGVKPVGTSLSIDIASGGSMINLKKGKIQTYFINKSGRLEKSTIETAPYRYDFPAGTGMVSMPDVDVITEQANEMVKLSEADQKDKLAEENSSVYQNFIGATISVIHSNGSRISGVLEYVYGGKLNIKTKSGLVEVIGNDMILVSLDTSSASENNSFFGEKK